VRQHIDLTTDFCKASFKKREAEYARATKENDKIAVVLQDVRQVFETSGGQVYMKVENPRGGFVTQRIEEPEFDKHLKSILVGSIEKPGKPGKFGKEMTAFQLLHRAAFWDSLSAA
jgi:hypothetical protein